MVFTRASRPLFLFHNLPISEGDEVTVQLMFTVNRYEHQPKILTTNAEPENDAQTKKKGRPAEYINYNNTTRGLNAWFNNNRAMPLTR